MIDLSGISRQPLVVELPDRTDYFKLFYVLKSKYKSAYLFESLVLPKQQDRYFTIGFDPKYVISSSDDETIEISSKKGKEKFTVENPFFSLKKILPKIPDANPYFGGLVGYCSYEAVNYVEPSLKLDKHPMFPLFEFGLYLDGLVYDNHTNKLKYFSFDQDRSALIIEMIKSLDEVEIPDHLKSIKTKGFNISRGEYITTVENTLEEIKNGNTFQAEVGISKEYEITGDKIAIYTKLRETNPSPYMFYQKFSYRETFGASPEIVVSLKNGKILTTPAAGTIERGESLDEDIKNADVLKNDPKEVAEHNMLVDLHRNDISKVARPGSVAIDELMHIMKFKYVQHLVSDISGEIRADRDSFDLLGSIMPCGVLTGAPKIETIKIIKKNEKSPRGPYGGAVGRFSFNGDCVFAMPIRSLFFNGDRGYNQACAGIVADSRPENEYSEVIAKLTGMEKSIAESGSI